MRRTGRDYLRLLWLLARSGLRERMHYKANFLITLVLRTALTMVDFLLVAVILYRFKLIAGWDVYEVAVLYGPAAMAYGLFRMFADELERFERYLVSGDFEGLLVRPWPTLLTLLGRRIDFSRLGAVAQGGVIMAIGASNLIGRGALTPLAALYLAVVPAFGALILTALSLLTAAIGFWTIRIEELQVFVLYAPLTASYYPLSIYPGWLKALLYTVIPVAFVNYLPVMYLLGKGAGPWTLVASPAVAGLMMLIGYRAWLFGNRNYQGTGT